MRHECELDEMGRCQPCVTRFNDLMREVHTHACHRGDTRAVRTPLGFRLLKFPRKFFRYITRRSK
jgi:hypothetical protein